MTMNIEQEINYLKSKIEYLEQRQQIETTKHKTLIIVNSENQVQEIGNRLERNIDVKKLLKITSTRNSFIIKTLEDEFMVYKKSDIGVRGLFFDDYWNLTGDLEFERNYLIK